MNFARPWLLLLVALLPAVVAVYLRRRSRPAASIRFPDLGVVAGLARSHPVRWRHLLLVLRCAVLLLLVGALAGPRLESRFEEVTTFGVDIMVVLDCSGSMQAEDFKPQNRLEVAKRVVKEFVQGRKHDRMGLVVFAGTAFTQCPLTLDYGVLQTFVDRTRVGTVDRDGTAIGAALAAALNRLRDSSAKSRIIVLVTDGAENVEAMNMNYGSAALLAQALGVKIYTVGVGRDDEVPMPVQDPIFGKRYVWYRAELNEAGLKQVAEVSGGQYFRATNPEALEEIFKTIDRLEPSEIKVKHYSRYEELFARLAWPALLLLLVEVALAGTRLRTLP